MQGACVKGKCAYRNNGVCATRAAPTVFVRHPECVDDVFATALLAVYGTTARVRVGKDVGEVDALHVRKLIESRIADP